MERVMRKKRGALALLLGALLLCVLAGGCSEKTEMTYFQEAADVEEIKDALRDKRLCGMHKE